MNLDPGVHGPAEPASRTTRSRPSPSSTAHGHRWARRTGSVTFSVDGVPQATVALNSDGYAGWIPPSTFNAGTHTIGATYSGDASFTLLRLPRPTPSSFPRSPRTLYRDPCCKLFRLLEHRRCHCRNCSFSAGDTLRVEVQISRPTATCPTGAITVNVGSLSQNVTLIPGGGLLTESAVLLCWNSGHVWRGGVSEPSRREPIPYRQLTQAIQIPCPLPPRLQVRGLVRLRPTPWLPRRHLRRLQPSTTTMSVHPTFVRRHIFGRTSTITATVTGPSRLNHSAHRHGRLLRRWVDDCIGSAHAIRTEQRHCDRHGSPRHRMDVGSSQLKAVYSGDSVYQSSAFPRTTSSPSTVAPRFSARARNSPQLTVQPGGSATAGFNLASARRLQRNRDSHLHAVVEPHHLQPQSDRGQPSTELTTTTLTVKASAQAVALARPQWQSPARWPLRGGGTCIRLVGCAQAQERTLAIHAAEPRFAGYSLGCQLRRNGQQYGRRWRRGWWRQCHLRRPPTP